MEKPESLSHTSKDIKLISSMDGLLDSTLLSDGLRTTIQQMREGVEHHTIHGYVSVVKNPGRPDEDILCRDVHNLLVDDGRDEIHEISYTEGSATVGGGFNYIAVSTNATSPSTEDSTMPGEVDSSGLARLEATTQTHTPGSNQSTLVVTFTATGSVTAVQKSGLFDRAGAQGTGILSHEGTFTSANLVNTDTLQVTWVITLG